MSKGRITDIEILRGFAVVFVVLHHAHGNLINWASPRFDYLTAHFSGGFGVDLFLAISGFVIARDLLPRLSVAAEQGGVWRCILAFWVRRAWRLLPSAWLWLIVVLAAVLWFNSSGVFGTWRANLDATYAALLQIANWRFVETFMRSEYGASFVYWSLSLEEQFYVLLPLVALLSRRWLPHVLAVLVLYQLFASRGLLMVMFRSDALMLGVLLAIWSRTGLYARLRSALPVRFGAGTLLLAGMSLLMGAFWADVINVGSYKFSLVALGSILLVWIASYDADVLLPEGVMRRLMIWVGTRSYAIYLIHVPAFFAIREGFARLYPSVAVDERFFYPFVLCAAVLIVLLSELNFRLIETPLRRKGAVLSRRLAGQPDMPVMVDSRVGG
ncbi:acyltransferase [Pseudomonas sp. LA21]|uniref:acyltransferase family protein n=1 Tax=unclassified Pseudomonas TaxID=196821 RepID=UPI001FB73B16|nr:acyltransferase [Pseudomonas sp. LA21]MCJ1886163.1 acyltransferase [Pseudomonas sp. LA21]